MKAFDAICKKDETNLGALKLQREKAEARLAEAKALKFELENAHTEKVLIPLADAEKEYGDLVQNFRTRILAIPNRAAYSIAAMRDPGQVEKYLNELICEALDELTRTKTPLSNNSAPEAHYQ